MNFDKVEKIFIVAFALLNVFLFISYINRQNIQHISADTNPVDILSEMSTSGIQMPKKLKKETKQQKVYSMQANAHQLLEDEKDTLKNQAGSIDEDGALYRSLLSNPLTLRGNPKDGFGQDDIKKLNEALNSNLFLFGSEYKYSHFASDRKQFIFQQVVDGIPVADGTSEIVLNVDEDGKVFSYEQTYAGPMTKQGHPITIISAVRAVEVLFINNKIARDAKLSMPQLTYRRSLHLDDLSMYTPAWLVEVETEAGEMDTLRVDAINGTILKDEAVTKVDETAEEE